MWKVCVRQYECGLLFDGPRLVRVLDPGTHRIWRPWRVRIERICCLEPQCKHRHLGELLRHAQFRARVRLLQLAAHQRALVWNGSRLAAVVGPGLHAFWKGPNAVRVELCDARVGRLKHRCLDAVAELAHATTLFNVVNVGSNERLCVLRNSTVEEILGPGAYVFWQGAPGLHWKVESGCGAELAVGRLIDAPLPRLGRSAVTTDHRLAANSASARSANQPGP